VTILLILNRSDEANQDAEAANRLDPNDARVLLALGQARLARKQTDEGIALLARAYSVQSAFDVVFLYGKALSDRGKEGDIEAALKAFLGLSIETLPLPVRAPIVTQVIQCFAKRKEWTDATSYLDRIAGLLDPAAVAIFRGYLAHYQGLEQDAGRYASEALSSLASHGNPDTSEVLARLLMLLGRPTEALPLWQSLFDLDQPGFDAGNLLDCAARLHKDDVVLKTCEQLHARGVVDWHLLEFEIQYLLKYHVEVAIERLRDFLAANPEHLLARLRLSMIGILLNRKDLVRATRQDIPDVTDLPADYVIPAVQVMRFGGA
jgi:tetratricopeptide (TPR) repeat protein